MDINYLLYQRAARVLSDALIDRSGVGLSHLQTASIFEQAKVIHQLFGYPFEIDISTDRHTLIDLCEDILYFYESAIMDSPMLIVEKARDPIGHMPQDNLLHKFMNSTNRNYPSLKDCLIPAGKEYKMKTGLLDTLKDALVSLLEPIAPEVNMNDFWNEAIQFSWKVKQGTEKIPF